MLMNLVNQEEQYFTTKDILKLGHIIIKKEAVAYMIPYSGSLQLFSAIQKSQSKMH